ncbi:MAG: YhbY family RNA-binding protein [Candidatus Methanomethylophilaceae archaeon]|jgi:RNA-binding protein
MTEKEAKKEIMRRATEIKPTVHVGKEGLDQGLTDEIIAQLKNRRIIKVRVLDNSGDAADDIAKTVADSTDSVIVDVRGSVIVLTDKRTWNSLCQKKF